jgi:hypothetical protein
MRPRDGIDAQRAIAPHAESELHALWDLYRDGTVREMYSPGSPGAVLLLEADSVDAAQGVLARLPLIANEIMALELIELHPFAAFQMLFRDSSQPPSEGTG